jgi:CheY-like chemotaxis protein
LEALKTKTDLLKKVLYVDDDRFAQTLVSAALADRFVFESETSGANAVATAESVNPDVILLDLAMPNVDGFEVLMKLKNNPNLSSIPVICLSGKQDEDSRTRAYKLGASGFILKPVDVKQLSNDIDKLIASMNSTVSSIDSRRTVFIGFNSNEIRVKMQNDIRNLSLLDKPTVVLSCASGNDFFSSYADTEKPTELSKLIFMQIKPAFMTRLPYLENLNSITGELKSLLDMDPSNYTLLFNEPEVVLSSKDVENKSATALLLGQTLTQLFPKVNYYMKASVDQKINTEVNSVAKMLVGLF